MTPRLYFSCVAAKFSFSHVSGYLCKPLESYPKRHLIDSERLTAKVICAFCLTVLCSRCGNIFASGTTRGEKNKTSFVCINQRRIHLSAVFTRVRMGEYILGIFSWTSDKDPDVSLIRFDVQSCRDSCFLP